MARLGGGWARRHVGCGYWRHADIRLLDGRFAWHVATCPLESAHLAWGGGSMGAREVRSFFQWTRLVWETCSYQSEACSCRISSYRVPSKKCPVTQRNIELSSVTYDPPPDHKRKLRSQPLELDPKNLIETPTTHLSRFPVTSHHQNRPRAPVRTPKPPYSAADSPHRYEHLEQI